MRLAVLGSGYQGAVEAFVTGNELAADATTALADGLAGSAGMAGDDTTATGFASSYDDAAAASLEALTQLTGGFASLAQLADASLRNHAHAETVTGPPTAAGRSFGVVVGAPPSSLGAGPSSLPGWAHPVLAALEGVFWPTADIGRLRSAGATWRAAAASVGLLAAHCSTALAALADEVSPEIPLAVAATEDLRGHTEALADQLAALGTACEAYADQVDAKRDEVLDLLEELAWELGVGAVVSGALTFVTGGGAAPVAGAAGTARVAAASARVRGVLDSLAVLTRGTATTLRPVATSLRDTRAYLSRLAAARRMEMTERGSADFGAYLRRSSGFLRRHEGVGRGHSIERHVAKSREWLQERVVNHRTARFASSFRDEAVADRAVTGLLRTRTSEIEAWMSASDRQLTMQARLRNAIGICVDRSGNVVDATGIRIVLVKDPTMAEGFYIKTAFPTP
ncbi:RNase A-like domain-containing protein [Nocardioides sp.]|uniref:RNase A-like domain-containing protein n=1 Tax=Nocardioides sp. TaxID=35761 RepID=UPI0037851ECB